ncbi:MAG: MBL fold metallo-hydrolase [Pseudomonadota bacterium]
MSIKSDRFRLTFLGAARTVTGSMHLLEGNGQCVLVDCGMFQGRRKESNFKNRNIPKAAIQADTLLLTHAHIDHSGNIPSLVKKGFTGKIHCTYATAELCNAMLRDSARIQESDAAWLNKKNRDNPEWEEIYPLYTEEDAKDSLAHFEAHDYEKEFSPVFGYKVRFIDAGHVLGSSSVLADVKMNGHYRRIAFSGDIGRRNLPILKDPVPPEHPDYVLMESTYGDRMHSPIEGMQQELLEAIEDTRARGGKVIIPSFALERAQEVVFSLNQLVKDGRLKPIPIFVDSPLTVNLTEVFRRRTECYDEETVAFDLAHGDPFGFDMLTMVESVEESKRLNQFSGPAVIISASGMCEGGRIVHHLRNNIEDPKNTIVIIGYQAQHTLGRRIVERRPRVKIFGVERDLFAQVRVLNSFSAHADRDELLWWAKECGRQVRNFFLVHGDPDQCEALGEHLKEQGQKSLVPSMGESVDLDR